MTLTIERKEEKRRKKELYIGACRRSCDWPGYGSARDVCGRACELYFPLEKCVLCRPMVPRMSC